MIMSRFLKSLLDMTFRFHFAHTVHKGQFLLLSPKCLKSSATVEVDRLHRRRIFRESSLLIGLFFLKLTVEIRLEKAKGNLKFPALPEVVI